MGLPIAAAAFHSPVLTYWRRRLAASARPNRVFDAAREVVQATGALSGKTRRVLNSTVLTDAVATQDTVTRLIAAIRRVAREVPPVPPRWSRRTAPGTTTTRPASRRSPRTTPRPAPIWSAR